MKRVASLIFVKVRYSADGIPTDFINDFAFALLHYKNANISNLIQLFFISKCIFILLRWLLRDLPNIPSQFWYFRS